MKRSIFSLILGVIAVLGSCGRSDEGLMQPQEVTTCATFQVEAPIVTRAVASGVSRYIVEAYEGKNLAITPIRVESATGTLTLTLQKDTEYTFLFWADKGKAKTETVESSGYYNATDLKAVTVSADKLNTIGEPAYCLAKTFNSEDFDANKSVTLKNATAQVNFVETEGLMVADNTLVTTYPGAGTLNVATGGFAETGLAVTHTFLNIARAVPNGTIATDYVLAPLGEKRLADLKVTFNSEAQKSITAVPFQQNYKTNIKGEYSDYGLFTFTVTADDTWETPDNNNNLVP